MLCPRCGQLAALGVGSCLHCGADLFTVPLGRARQKAIFYAAIGAMLYGFMRLAADVPVERLGKFTLVRVLEATVGRWPPVLAVWAISLVFLIRDWRERSRSRRSQAASRPPGDGATV